MALLPSWFRPACLTSRFICRQSARVFSSPALHACFAARAPERVLRRSLRRCMPFVCADAGTMPASATMVARTPTPLQKLIFRRMVLLWCSNRSLKPSLSPNNPSPFLLKGPVCSQECRLGKRGLPGSAPLGSVSFHDARGRSPLTRISRATRVPVSRDPFPTRETLARNFITWSARTTALTNKGGSRRAYFARNACCREAQHFRGPFAGRISVTAGGVFCRAVILAYALPSLGN